jgi:serine/threonine-protein kinase
MIGASLSHYRITEKLGQGGMGEVYRAEDTNLSRQVAIKVLPEEFAHDAERLARFEREAKLLASLNHPNIAAIHGLEEHEGKRFLVLELVEGQTLAERLHKGPLPVEEALEVCRQIAEGLEAAHDKGIIHRDLKPANVKVTPEGKVKILDFGLAKAFYEQAAPVDPSRSPTITEQMTAPGVILGTAAYMSPEQARGKPVDKRADIWAFGCVLYECLTGKRAFPGDSITEVVAKILEVEPDWKQLPANTPAFVRSLLRRCLQKEPGLRLHDIADARIEIGESATQPSEAVVLPRKPVSRGRFALAVAGPIACVLIGAGLMWYFRPTPSPTVVRAILRIEPGPWLAGMGTQREFWRPSRTAMAISSDGRFIVYSGIEGNPSPESMPRLYLRRIDQMGAKPIAGTEGGIHPFLSPDDRWVGFWAGGRLVKVSVDGGVAVPLCEVAVPFGASWGTDDNVVFSPNYDVGLSMIHADGGAAAVLTTADKAKEEFSHRLPQCLPDGKSVLFTLLRDEFDPQPRIAILDLESRRWRVLFEDAADARYVSTGHLLFLRQGTLMAVRFDLNRLEIRGQPVPAIADVMQAINSRDCNSNTTAGQFSVSNSGMLVYASGSTIPDEQNSLVWVDQNGTSQPVADFRAPIYALRLSRHGDRIAYSTNGRYWRVWAYDQTRDAASRVTGDNKALYVLWTPDDKRVFFGYWQSGFQNIFWQPTDGSASMERLTTSQFYQYPGSLSPDGETLAFAEERQANMDILLLDLRNRRVRPFLNSPAYEAFPEFSPDGHWLAYTSSESGRNEVYVQPFPGLGGRWQVSSKGGVEPLWSPNGRQLFYRLGDQVWVVDVQAGSGFSASKPRLLFEKPGYGRGSPIRSWDISLDGKRFLMVKLEERKPQPVTEMILVENWFEELKRLCPIGKN